MKSQGGRDSKTDEVSETETLKLDTLAGTRCLSFCRSILRVWRACEDESEDAFVCLMRPDSTRSVSGCNVP